jgi:hypothetical protein
MDSDNTQILNFIRHLPKDELLLHLEAVIAQSLRRGGNCLRSNHHRGGDR